MRLCGNARIGDDGLRALLAVLAEDVWIQSVHMQSCGLTAGGADALLDCLRTNRTLVVFDVCRNAGIPEAHMQRLRALHVVESPLDARAADEAASSAAGGSSSAAASGRLPAKTTDRQLLDFQNARLGERIAFLEQQLQIETVVRAQAEQLNRRLHDQMRAQEQQPSAVPAGFVLVPTQQLNDLVLE